MSNITPVENFFSIKSLREALADVAGGNITFCGTPEALAQQQDNFTGQYLAEELAAMKR